MMVSPVILSIILLGFCLALVVRILDDCLVQLVVEEGVLMVLLTLGSVGASFIDIVLICVEMGLLTELVV